MGKSVSSDLRLRMVRGIASGKSRRAVAAQFEISPSTAVWVQARYAATGSVAPARQGRPRGSGKLSPYRQVLALLRRPPHAPTTNSGAPSATSATSLIPKNAGTISNTPDMSPINRPML